MTRYGCEKSLRSVDEGRESGRWGSLTVHAYRSIQRRNNLPRWFALESQLRWSALQSPATHKRPENFRLSCESKFFDFSIGCTRARIEIYECYSRHLNFQEL